MKRDIFYFLDGFIVTRKSNRSLVRAAGRWYWQNQRGKQTRSRNGCILGKCTVRSITKPGTWNKNSFWLNLTDYTHTKSNWLAFKMFYPAIFIFVIFIKFFFYSVYSSGFLMFMLHLEQVRIFSFHSLYKDKFNECFQCHSLSCFRLLCHQILTLVKLAEKSLNFLK